MTPATYRKHRRILGSRAKAAKILGVSRETIRRRETGVTPVSTEAAAAMVALTESKPQPPADGKMYWERGV